MSQFLCKTSLFGCCILRALSKSGNVCALRRIRFSTGSEEDDPKRSFVVSYLTGSLGFSLKNALLVSKGVHFESSERPDKAIEFFKGRGFTNTQISTVVKLFPKVLIYNTGKIILPKLEFLKAKGISDPETAKILSVFPCFMRYSLDKRLVPAYEYYKSIFRSDYRTIVAVKKHPCILTYNTEKCVSPNVDTLRRNGVIDCNIATLINCWPQMLSTNSARFRGTVEEVVKMGFDPTKPMVFFLGVSAVLQKTGNSKWESKVRLYKKWGWSDGDISEAFLRSPWCMLVSRDKIMAFMEFFIAEMGLRPSDLAKCPIVFTYSLRKRVVPRVLLCRELVSKGLLKKDVNLVTVVTPTEELFLQRFIAPHTSQAPELMKLYKEKLDLSSRRPKHGRV